MNLIHRTLLCGLAFAALTPAAQARAEDQQSVRIEAEALDFSDDVGSQRTVRLEYKYVTDDTTVLVTPAWGRRSGGGTSKSAFGLGGTVYHDWSDSASTRTAAFIAADTGVFAHLELDQDVTFKVAKSTTLTLGGRWSQYQGGKDVWFASLGARQYFNGGSVAYRLTRVMPEGANAFFGHLINVTLNDGHGAGKTQLWLSTGTSEQSRNQLAQPFSGRDYAAMFKRTQPLSGKLALIAGAGVSSLDRPAGRVTATDFQLGLQMGIK